MSKPPNYGTDVIFRYLKDHGYSCTKPRLLVFQQLLKGPTSPQDLVHALRKSMDSATVYRTVTLFEKLDIAHRIWQGKQSAIELTDDFYYHHHHFVCEQCNKLIDFTDPQLEKALQQLSERLKLQVNHHHLELFGRCSQCR